MEGATAAYTVTAQDVDGDGNVVDGAKKINQPVVSVGPSVITVRAVHGAPDDKDENYFTNLKVSEVGEALPE